MSTYIKYTSSEKLSFKLCPETCPLIEKAFFDAARHPMPDIAHFMQRNGKPVDAKTIILIQDLLGMHVSQSLNNLEDIVLHEGTFKLRRALVELIESQTCGPHQPNHFAGWIESWQRRKSK